MRIGLFGGTFNPIHTGHMQIALKVKQSYSFDKILFIPSALPPHKTPEVVVDVNDRLEMMHQALMPYPDFAISDVEIKRPGLSYTIDTVRYFNRTANKHSTLYLLLGLDAFFDIDTWKSYTELFLQIPFIVVNRKCERECGTAGVRASVGEYLQSKVSESYQYSASHACFLHNEKQPVFIFDVTPIDISSTNIRRLIHKGGSIKQMVPDVVENYIKRKGLYL